MGRMVPIKGIDLLADVVQMAKNDSVMFVVAGDGPLRPRFEELTGGAGNIRMVGWQRDVAPLLKACGAVILTSVNEGTPTSLIEAMFAAKPFVATDAGGTRDLAIGLNNKGGLIGQAQNGFIVERDAETMTMCLAKLATDLQLRETMGR